MLRGRMRGGVPTRCRWGCLAPVVLGRPSVVFSYADNRPRFSHGRRSQTAISPFSTATSAPTSWLASEQQEYSDDPNWEKEETVPAKQIAFTKAGGKCDAVDYQIFTFLLSALRHYNLSTEIRLTGGWIRDRLMFPTRKSQGMDFVLSDVQGGSFCKLLQEYARKSKRIKSGDWTEKVNIQTRGNKWAVWFLSRELRFEQRVARTWGEEAKRRDFTVNSLFYNLHDQTVEDYTNRGLDDVANRVLRTPIPAIHSLFYDPVRMLRAIRFSRSHFLSLEPELEYAMYSPKIQERFTQNSDCARRETELRKILVHRNSSSMYQDLVRFNVHRDLFKFPKFLSSSDPSTSHSADPPSALSAFSSLPPLAAEISLPVNPWNERTTTKAVSSVTYLRKLIPRPKDDVKESMAMLLAFVSPSLLANWNGYNPFSAQLAFTTVSAVKSSLSLPPTWARELRELLIATVDLLHIAHEFIPTIHAFHQMDDDLSELESGYHTLVHRRRHDMLHWLRNNRDYWRLATLLAHTMLVHGSPRYHFDFNLFEKALEVSGVSEAAYIEPILNGNEIKDVLPPELYGKSVGELKEALVSWQWEAAKPTKEGAVQFVREYITRAGREPPSTPRRRGG